MLRRPSALLAILVLLTTAATASHAADFRLTSPTIKPGSSIGSDQVFNGFGCSGKNISPALNWSGVPEGTRSLALTVYDPDAPTGSGWWHWVVYNLPAATTGLAQGAGDAAGKLLPAGAVQGRTDFGTAGFGGPCPPAGDKPHRYIFTLYALKTDKLDIPAGSTAAMVGFMISANKLSAAKLTAKYGR